MSSYLNIYRRSDAGPEHGWDFMAMEHPTAALAMKAATPVFSLGEYVLVAAAVPADISPSLAKQHLEIYAEMHQGDVFQ